MNVIPKAVYLNEALIYVAGDLYFRQRPRSHFKSDHAWNMWNAKFAGRRAGRKMPNGGYRQVMLGGVRYLEHRVIAAMFGLDTSQQIDHVDGDGLNNRIENLRPASILQNTKNNPGWSKKAARVGVHKKLNGRWTAYIRAGGKHLHLGTFIDEQEAINARVAAEREHYGEFAVSASRLHYLEAA